MLATDEQIIEFIQAVCDENGFSPSIREICKEFGYASTSTVKFRLDRMRRDGLVTFNDRLPRTLKVTGMKVVLDGVNVIGFVKPAKNADGFNNGNIIIMVQSTPVELPDRVYVDMYGKDEDGNPGNERGEYREVKYCDVRLVPMSGYHCSACGELVTLYDGNDMLRRVRYCPCCGAENRRFGID